MGVKTVEATFAQSVLLDEKFTLENRLTQHRATVNTNLSALSGIEFSRRMVAEEACVELEAQIENLRLAIVHLV